MGIALLTAVSIGVSLRSERREPRAVIAAFRSAIVAAFLLQLILQALSLLRFGWIDGLLLFVGLFVSIAYSWVVSMVVILLRRWLRQNMPP